MDTKQLLELLKCMLEKDIQKTVPKDDYLEYATSIAGDLKRIYYIDKELQLLKLPIEREYTIEEIEDYNKWSDKISRELHKNINKSNECTVLNKIKKLLLDRECNISLSQTKDRISQLNTAVKLNAETIEEIKKVVL